MPDEPDNDSGPLLIKAALLRTMKLLYPDGVADVRQQRDIIRVFTLGWREALRALGDTAGVEEWTNVTKGLHDFNWWPDTSWRWWR